MRWPSAADTQQQHRVVISGGTFRWPCPSLCVATRPVDPWAAPVQKTQDTGKRPTVGTCDFNPLEKLFTEGSSFVRGFRVMLSVQEPLWCEFWSSVVSAPEVAAEAVPEWVRQARGRCGQHTRALRAAHSRTAYTPGVLGLCRPSQPRGHHL